MPASTNTDSTSSNLKMEEIDNSHYRYWKIRIQHDLALKDLEHFLEDDPPTSTPAEIVLWKKNDKKAQAIIKLTLSNDLLKNVREVQSTKEMWIAIKNFLERLSLLNKLSARKNFYAVTMNSTETALQFANRIRHLASTLTSMKVSISESEMAMALMNGLAEKYTALINALDPIDEDETKVNFEFIKSRVMQEELRIMMRTNSAQTKSDTAALISNQSKAYNRSTPNNRSFRSRRFCNYCKWNNHVESKRWAKFPHLNPKNKNSTSHPKPALLANQIDEDPVVCLMAKYKNSNEPINSGKWFVDSGCSNHMTYNKTLFSS